MTFRAVTLEDFVKRRPDFYFGGKSPNARRIAQGIAKGARCLGANNVQVLERSSLTFVCSDVDWLYLGKFPEKGQSIWEAPYGFPEMGQNCFRYEAVARVFSRRLVSWSRNEIDVVKGENLGSQELEAVFPGYEDVVRGIGFEYCVP